MPKSDLSPLQWLEAFEVAITLKEIDVIASFIRSLPDFETTEQITQCLSLTLEAEVILNSEREILLAKRNSLLNILSR